MDACFQRQSPNGIDLWNVSDRFWEGFVQYGVQGNLNGSDPWNGVHGFMEKDPTPFMSANDLDTFPAIDPGAPDIMIYEPCNSVSNLAFIRTMLEICEHDKVGKWSLDNATVTGLVRAFNLLTPGSTLFHASGTEMGLYLDEEGIRLFALLVLQGMLQKLPYNPILYDLSKSPRNYTGKNATATASRIILNNPLEQWYKKIVALRTEE